MAYIQNPEASRIHNKIIRVTTLLFLAEKHLSELVRLDPSYEPEYIAITELMTRFEREMESLLRV